MHGHGFVPRFDELGVGNIYKYYIAYEMALERNKKKYAVGQAQGLEGSV